MKTSRLALWLVMAVIIGITGCARSPKTTFYVLESMVPIPAPEQQLADGLRVAVGPVAIPAYLDRQQLFIRQGNTVAVQLDDFHQWSEPLEAGITRVLCAELSAALAPQRGFAFPLRSHLSPQWRLAVNIARFDGAPNEPVVLDASWTLTDESGEEAHSGRFVDQEHAGEDRAGLVRAQSLLLSRFGKALGQAVRE